MKKSNFVVTLIMFASLATVLTPQVFAGAGHDHEGPQLPRRWTQQDNSNLPSEVKQEDRATASKKEEATQNQQGADQNAKMKKEGRDLGSVPSGSGQATQPLEAQKVEQQKPETKGQSSSESESEKPRRRPFHHAGRFGG